MHTETGAIHLSARILMLAFYFIVLVPAFFYSEYCIIHHFNELVRCWRKHEDYQTLIDKTGSPLFVIRAAVKSEGGGTGEIVHQNQQALSFLARLNLE